MKNSILIYLCIFLSNTVYAKITQVFDIGNRAELSIDSFIKALPRQGHIVLGEFHNTPSIQEAQAELINSKVIFESLSSDFSIHWEFLNHTDSMAIKKISSNLNSRSVDPTKALLALTTASNLVYLPLFKVLQDKQGEIFGINLPRNIKQKVIKEGIGSIDPQLVPNHHYVGNESYNERFITAMGNHAPADVIEKYFTAQCLTDSVMADQIYKHENLSSLNFTIAGSFHTDFYDGTVVRLMSLTNMPVVTLKIINTNSHTPEEITEFKNTQSKYGPVADYLILTE
jgi:uncharacterized iron-regulated protein